MELVNLKDIEKLMASKNAPSEEKVITVLDSVQKMHKEFEHNPKSLSQEVAETLDQVADEFADFIRRIIHQSDEVSKKLGEISIKIVKLCVRLHNKIFFYNKGKKAFALS